MSAALSFYISLSFAPLALLFIVACSMFTPGLELNFGQQVGLVAGSGARNLFHEIVNNSQESPKISSVSGWIGILSLIFSASVIFGELRANFNKIFGVKSDLRSLKFKEVVALILREKVAHIGLLLSFIFLLVVSLVVSTILSAFPFAGETIFSGLFNMAMTFIFYGLIFALMLRYVPDKRQPWGKALRGGIFVALLFSIGKEVIGLYLGKSALGSTYGAAGSAIVFMAWTYYSSMVIFLGAVLVQNLTDSDEKMKEPLL